MDSDDIPEITDKIVDEPKDKPVIKRFRGEDREVKPLFKFRIKDLLGMNYDKSNDVFKFKNYNVSFIMCGGKISDIFRDDTIFSFERKNITDFLRFELFNKFFYSFSQWWYRQYSVLP